MSTNGSSVLDEVVRARVRELHNQADRKGEARLGRPSLVAKLTEELGATPHQVRKAKELVEATETPAGASVTPALRRNRRLRPGTSRLTRRTTPSSRRLEPSPALPPASLEPAGASPDSAGASDRQDDLQPLPTSTRGGRFVAWLGFAFGSVMSIAANVLHTWLPADDMPPGWAPALAPQIGAAVWPIGLLISVEVLSRVTWRRGPLWSLARYGGAGAVAIGSGVISYGHLREVLVAWGYGHPGADVGPLVLDGLMVVCGFALLSMTPRQAGASR